MAGAVHAQGSGTVPPADNGLRLTPQLRTSPGLRVHRLPDDDIPAYLQADHMQGDPDSNVTLTGTAEVRRIDGVAKGDRIDYRSDTGAVDIKGNARLMRDGTLVTGPSAQFNIDTDSGEIESPNFWIGASGGSARAERAEIFSRSQMRLTTVQYSGCACVEP